MSSKSASPLYFNADKYEFWEIYERIKLFYPIGIGKADREFYYSFPGLKALQQQLVENFHDTQQYEVRWTGFLRQLEEVFGRRVVDTTYGQKPAFSASIELEKTENDNLTRRKEFHFFVSVLGPFYTVIGCDVNTVTLGPSHYMSTNYLVISPEQEFAAPFNNLCDIIEARFSGFRFVPFYICEATINGLCVADWVEDHSSVFNALFGDFLDRHPSATIGISHYKSDDWIRDGYVDNGVRWTGYPPVDFND